MSYTGDYLSSTFDSIGNSFSSIDSLGSALDAYNNITDLFINKTKIKIGKVTLTGYSLPEYIEGGGENAQTLHQYPGGGRTIDSTGPDDAPITWSGIFLGAQASATMKILDAMRRGGSNYTLSFCNFNYNVSIKRFTWKFRRKNYIDYEIVLNVVAPMPASGATGFFDSIKADIQTATGINVDETLAKAQTAVANTQQLALQVTSITGGGPKVLGLLNGLNTANAGLNAMSNLAQGNIGSFKSYVTANTSPEHYIVAQKAVLPSLSSLSAIKQQQAYLGRAAKAINVGQ